ncbi:YjzC family protein [Barrientosiimonas marina]|uniref:YjzC family protein n=1 Tax=Lentibacillus kimchii TaxID=1542911 RepID=A0ABW2UTK6_9BACI
MGEQSQFNHGDKAPNNGVYIEHGETGSNVESPDQIEMEAGDKFPETSNQDRIWVHKRDLSKKGVDDRSSSH